MNPDEHEEVIGALKEVAQLKFQHGKRHGFFANQIVDILYPRNDNVHLFVLSTML